MTFNKLLTVLIFTFVLILSSFSEQLKPRIAVLPFNPIGVSKNDALVVTGLFETGLVKTESFNVIKQQQVNEILAAQAFTLTGCTDDACAIEFGKLLAAEQIVLGDLSSIGGKYILNVKIIDVELGKNIKADSVETSKLSEMTGAAELLAFKLAGLIYSEGENVQIADERVRTPSFLEEAAKYGSIKVSVVEAGTVYIDGVRMGELSANRSATMSDITTGSHQLEIRYGSNTERKTITVSENGIANASFSGVDSSTVVMGNRDSSSVTGTGDNYVFIRGGTFKMGSTNLKVFLSSAENDEKPAHSVTVSSFYMSKYEVTQKEYKSIIDRDPSDIGRGIGDKYPVNNIDWYEAVEYCNALSKKEGLTPVYSGSGMSMRCNFNANGYRLPTEAEWEYAARGGNSSKGYTYAGSNTIGNVAWYKDNSGSETHPVGTKQPNELGLYDMSGNVSEWCWDWYGNYSSSSQNDPSGASSDSSRVDRGGSWGHDASFSRSANRNRFIPVGRISILGFRVVRRP